MKLSDNQPAVPRLQTIPATWSSATEVNGLPTPRLLTTAEFAELARDAKSTILKNHCLQGHHHGVRPLKMPNGRLRWRYEEVMALLVGVQK